MTVTRFVRLLKSVSTILFNKFEITHVKSNQSKGAWLGVCFKLKNKKIKFLHRSGYCWSDFTFRLTGSYLKFFSTRAIELLTNLFCDQIHVASELDTKTYFSYENKKVKIVPNWVDFLGSPTVKGMKIQFL